MIPFLFGFAVACFIWSAAFFWLNKRRSKAPPLTMYRRKYRDSPERNQVGELREGVEREPHEPFYMYGVTGEEQ